MLDEPEMCRMVVSSAAVAAPRHPASAKRKTISATMRRARTSHALEIVPNPPTPFPRREGGAKLPPRLAEPALSLSKGEGGQGGEVIISGIYGSSNRATSRLTKPPAGVRP